MKEKPLASLPQGSPKAREVKWSRKLTKKGHSFQIPQTSQKRNSESVKLFGEVWNRQNVMDNSRIVQKNGFTGRFEPKIDRSQNLPLKWLLWQDLVQYLCGKMIFYLKYVERKVLRTERLLTYDLGSTKGFAHGWGGGGVGLSKHVLFCLSFAFDLRSNANCKSHYGPWRDRWRDCQSSAWNVDNAFLPRSAMERHFLRCHLEGTRQPGRGVPWWHHSPSAGQRVTHGKRVCQRRRILRMPREKQASLWRNSRFKHHLFPDSSFEGSIDG